MLASTHAAPRRQGRRPQLPFLRPALPSRRPHLRAPEESSLRPRGPRSPPASGDYPERQRPTTATRSSPALPLPQPRRRTRSRSDPPRHGPAGGHTAGLRPLAAIPGQAGTGRSHPRPHRALPVPGRSTRRVRRCPAAPPRSSPRYSGPGSESRSGLSILPPPPLPPGFRPFPRRPTLPALRARRCSAARPGWEHAPTPPGFRAQNRPRSPRPATPEREDGGFPPAAWPPAVSDLAGRVSGGAC